MDVKDELELLKKAILGLDVKIDALDINDSVWMQLSHTATLIDVAIEFLLKLEKSIEREKQQAVC